MARTTTADLDELILVAADLAEEEGDWRERILRASVDAVTAKEFVKAMKLDPAFGANVEVDVDHSYVIAGVEEDGEDADYAIYFNVAEGLDGWYVGLLVDGPNWVDALDHKGGPYSTERDALSDGYYEACEVIAANGLVPAPETFNAFLQEQVD